RESNLQVAKLCLLLNRVAQACLYPPSKLLLSAVVSDFKKSQGSTIPSLVQQLFATTAFHVSHRGLTPNYASLSTFRANSPAQIMAIVAKYSHFHLWARFSHVALLLLWFINLALVAALPNVRKEEVATVSSDAAALML